MRNLSISRRPLSPLSGAPAWPASTVSNAARHLTVGAKTYEYFSLKAAEKNGLEGVVAAAVLDEDRARESAAQRGRAQRHQGGHRGGRGGWLNNGARTEHEIAFRPARVLMQDFTGVPAVVDLAAMRDAMTALGGDPEQDQPARAGRPRHRPFGGRRLLRHAEVARAERRARIRAEPGALPLPELGPAGVLQFLRRAAGHRHLPPGQSRISRPDGLDREGEADGKTVEVAYPDTLVGTDSHTTMVNGLAVLGWGVGGIEAEAAMLGQPLSMLLPEVIGFKLTGELREGVTATDLVLTVTQMLRKKGVVGKFVEFYGPGLNAMTVADRATHRQHGARIRRDLRPLPDRRADPRLSEDLRPQAGAHRAGRGLRQGAGHCSAPAPRPTRSSPTRSSSTSARSRPRSPARSARRTACVLDRGQGRLRRTRWRPSSSRPTASAVRHKVEGDELRPRPRRRRDRRDHLLHQHLQPERDDRGRPRRPQRGRQGPDRQAVGEDLARAGQPGGRRTT